MQNLQEKSLRAIGTLLERKGYEIIDSEWGSEEDKVIGVVAKDDDILVFLMLKKKNLTMMAWIILIIFLVLSLKSKQPSGSHPISILLRGTFAFVLTRLIYSLSLETVR